MADEVPICDVLCEAMEYLSKLGSNLRARSESLKEKRIRKDKLKNSHAVQKAADKVLLICELSKKSLENVECGVRRVLTLVQDSYQPGHSRRLSSNLRKKSDDTDKYQYFRHLSHKLRICKSVPVKHYTSVKVLARNMPISLQSKYPVYLDCKLYRQRRRQEKARKSEVNNSDKPIAKTLEQKDNLSSLSIKDDSELSNTGSKTIEQNDINIMDSLGKENKASEKLSVELSEENDSHLIKNNNEDVVSQTLDSSSETSDKTHKNSNKKRAKTKVRFHSEDEDSNEQIKHKKRKFKHIKILDDSSENSNEPTSKEDTTEVELNDKEKKNHSFAETFSSKEDTTEVELNDKEKKIHSLAETYSSKEDATEVELDDKEKTIHSFAETYSSKEDATEVELSDEGNKNHSFAKTSSSEQESHKLKSSNVTKESENNDSHQKNVSKIKETEEEVTAVRPLIKCVSLTKLLKPNVVEKHDQPKDIAKTTTKVYNNKEVITKKKHRSSLDKTKVQVSEKSPEDDEDFWSIKRKEVKSFKHKKFTVDINRLPKITHTYLKQNSLKKITQYNAVICEVYEEKNETDGCLNKDNNIPSSSKESSHTKKSTTEKIDKVKNYLLNDSDSEKSDNNSINLEDIVDTVKNTLLDISVDDQEKTKDSQKDNIKDRVSNEKEICPDSNGNNDLVNTKKDDSHKKKQDLSKNTDIVSLKNALLCDSDSDSNTKEKENNSNEVKKSLLFESDSDENNERVETCTNNNDNNSAVDKSNSEQTNQTKISLQNDPDQHREFNAQLLKETCAENVQDPVSQLQSNDGIEKLSNIELSSNKENEVEPQEVQNVSDDELEIPLSKKRKNINIPKIKKKHVTESLHAKNMLLHYSSSSDTEDELLKNALSEIKESLLEGKSSEDENVVKETGTSKDSASSESEEDLRKEKRKAKRSESESTTQEVEKESTNSRDDALKGSGEDSEDEISNTSKAKMGRSRAHPGGSSQNSDSQEAIDKDIDGLTNLNSLMKNRRRLDSSTPDTTDSKSKRKTKKMAKAPLISEENMLKADSSSDAVSEAASGVDSDAGEGEDLPPVTLPGLNGSGIDHLAKDDLLDESDSSNSHNDTEEADKNESDEDHNPKSKRRKPHAISSDSEAGGSRTKTRDADARLSDFDESDDDNANSKTRRRKKADDSDASAGSSSNDGSKKKRRRIKLINDSDGSGSDTENEGKNKHGRKNIRKVMGKNQLEEATKKAAREEKERIARISERQKVYNNLEFDESGKPDEVVLEKVVLDFDPETKEPLIEVDRGLVKKLKPHQANGIKFMWDACFESVKRIKKDKGSGCILAHCMGLGKTLQVVSLTHTLLTHSNMTKVNRVLVVCPLSTVLNWVNEFKMWLKHSLNDFEVDVYELSRYKQNSERAFQLSQWVSHGGVCVLGYEMFRNLSADNNKKYKKKMLKHFQEALVEPGPDLVVCDEGHLLKNEKTSLSQSMNRVRTLRRIVLTGTPLQNNLKEYYCMVQFVKPNLLGKYNEYLNRFVNPITNGQYTDSTEHDIRIMKRRSHVLHKMLDGAVQRRDYGVLAPFLPPKHEYVLFITLTEVQIKLYQFYLDNYSRRPLPGKSSGFLFPDFQSLQRIWTHPLVLKYNSERYEIMQQKKREREEEEDSEGSLADFIDDDSTGDESSTEESSDDMSDASDDSRKKSKKKKAKKSKSKESKHSTRRGTRANPVELNNEEEVANTEVVEFKSENPTEWWIKLVTDDEIDDLKNSHKLILLFDILRQCDAIGDKLLVFSQSLYSLDLIEHFLGKVDEATQEGRIDEKLAGHVGSWSPGVDYFRLDGSTSCENRSIWCKNFNREDNPRARLFLISTRAGGLGINLVAANRVVIFDVSWNPSHDVQSIFRVYRFGQKKPCYVYRFLAMGTMEEKIYERQVTKQAISKRVIDEQQIDRHYAENDLAELYKFEPRPPVPRPLPPLPKDRLFAEMLREHEAQIYKYHEHDSLLENKEEETLSEEERKAAWEDFENEKNRPPPSPFPTAWPMHNGMMPGLLAQQQQQLAYAALASMLRKDMPNINDNTIRDMLPHIYNANPALMQKITEIYKYAPPQGMMNPGMMNPAVMNAASGGAAAMGGTSGLQYEPPWQRQHQQQQQLRLQQLMQHQNQMGAKYYAGGLGSRDPVAMALQQQRAREMQAGETRGRPRGRPPLQPRAPVPPHADVVNLDSD